MNELYQRAQVRSVHILIALYDGQKRNIIDEEEWSVTIDVIQKVILGLHNELVKGGSTYARGY